MLEASIVLNAALKELAEQYSHNLPDEVVTLFPRWEQEMPDILCSANKSQLYEVMQRLENEAANDVGSTVGYAFARSCLQAALDTHDAYGLQSYKDLSSPCSAYAERAASESEAELLLPRVMAGAPTSMREFFPDFEAELRAALTRPLADLRAAAARLEAASADYEVLRFTEHNDAPVKHEADALAFAVRAMQEVVRAKSTAAIAAAIASSIDAAIDAGLPIITSTRDGPTGRQDNFFRQPTGSSAVATISATSHLRATIIAAESDAAEERHSVAPHLPSTMLNALSHIRSWPPFVDATPISSKAFPRAPTLTFVRTNHAGTFVVRAHACTRTQGHSHACLRILLLVPCPRTLFSEMEVASKLALSCLHRLPYADKHSQPI